MVAQTERWPNITLIPRLLSVPVPQSASQETKPNDLSLITWKELQSRHTLTLSKKAACRSGTWSGAQRQASATQPRGPIMPGVIGTSTFKQCLERVEDLGLEIFPPNPRLVLISAYQWRVRPKLQTAVTALLQPSRPSLLGATSVSASPSSRLPTPSRQQRRKPAPGPASNGSQPPQRVRRGRGRSRSRSHSPRRHRRSPASSPSARRTCIASSWPC